jgi:hypothetical protein
MLRVLVLAGALALSGGGASAAVVTGGAPAHFIDFAGTGTADAESFAFDANGTEVTATGEGLFKPRKIRRTVDGLGVNGGFFDPEKDEVGQFQTLTLDFDRPFDLATIVLGDLTKGLFKTDRGHVSLVKDGAVFQTASFSAAAALDELATIAFAGGTQVDALVFQADGSASNFAVRGISEVPVPAALPLLATGLGALAWMRRRRPA